MYTNNCITIDMIVTCPNKLGFTTTPSSPECFSLCKVFQ